MALPPVLLSMLLPMLLPVLLRATSRLVRYG